MSKIRVALFESRAQAESIRLRLVQAGISAGVHSESALAKLWFVPRRQTSIRLEVSTKDAERAQRVLAGWDSERGRLKGAIHCPECRSMHVQFPQYTEKSLLTNLAMGLLAEFRLVEREYYCEDCHCMWAKPAAKTGRLRAHMAPNYFLEESRETPPEASARQGRDLRDRARDSSNISNEKKCSFHIFKLWRRILSLTILLGGIWLRIESRGTLITSEATAASANSNDEAQKGGTFRTQQASAKSETPTYLRDVLPILMGKCARCHNDQSQVMQSWLDYGTASSKRWEIKRRVWDSWKGAYFKQPMPSGNSPESEAITDEERAIIRDWVESGAARGIRPAFHSAQSKAERIEQGKRLFTTICAACHQPTGQGIPGRFPPLAGSDFLNSDKHRAIKILVNGLQGEVTVNGQKFNNTMPKFPLTDDDISNALTYVYNSFGNSGKEITPQEVNAARGERGGLNIAGQSQSIKVPEEKSPFE